MNEQRSLDLIREKTRLRHMKLSTEKSYVSWVRRYIRFIKKLETSLSSEQKVEAWLSDMAPTVSASTQNQAFSAVLFFYKICINKPLENVDALRAKKRRTQKHCPSQEEVKIVLDGVVDSGGYPVRLLTRLLYGCGMRVGEPLDLRIRDVRFEAKQLIIRDPKHGNDRVVKIPDSLVQDLHFQIANAKLIHERDRLHELPVALPDGLAKKYPYARFAWQWFYVFTLANPCKHPRTGETVRYRCLETTVQRAMRASAKAADLDGMTPHSLRHAYATHLLNAGANIRDIQESLGHRSLETTMTYTHTNIERIGSPLELLN